MQSPGIEKKPESKNNNRGITRRDFIKFLVSTILAACLNPARRRSREQPITPTPPSAKPGEPILPTAESNRTEKVFTIESAEKFFDFIKTKDGLYWKYLGLESEIDFHQQRFFLNRQNLPKNRNLIVFVTDNYIYVLVDYKKVLTNLMNEKRINSEDMQKLWNNFKESRLKLYKEGQPTLLSLEDYISKIDRILDSAKNSFKKIDEKDENRQIKELAIEFIKKISAVHLVSIILRELLPPPTATDGYSYDEVINFNIIFFEILLGSAGTEFIEHIPSLHDQIFSFGPLQITNIIEESVKKGFNDFIDTEKFKENYAALWNIEPSSVEIPFSILGLNGSWHYLWFLFNVLNNISGILLSKKNEETFLSFFKEKIIPNSGLILAISALIHHSPVNASKFINFLYEKYKEEKDQINAKTALEAFFGKQNIIKNYVQTILDYYNKLS